MRHPLSDEIITAIKAALKQFGEYNYYDKGPDEVMETEELLSKMEALSDEDLAKVCCDLIEYEHGQEWIDHSVEDFDFDFDYVKQYIKDEGVKVEEGSYFSDDDDNDDESEPIQVPLQSIGSILKGFEKK